jgi:hypothetical protein
MRAVRNFVAVFALLGVALVMSTESVEADWWFDRCGSPSYQGAVVYSGECGPWGGEYAGCGSLQNDCANYCYQTQNCASGSVTDCSSTPYGDPSDGLWTVQGTCVCTYSGGC